MISIAKWKKFQHYGKERPPWIKLYRDTLGEYEIMYQLEPAERWILLGLWMLAAETGNEIPHDVAFLSHRLRAEVTEPLLKKLQTLGLIEDGAPSRDTLEEVLSQAETEKRQRREETETKTTKARDVENSKDELPDYAHRPEYTFQELYEEANTVLGLHILSRADLNANHDILRDWRYKRKIPAEEVYAAIHGLRQMIDIGRPEVADWLQPGKPVSLKALNNTHTLFDQGDGKAKRVLFDVAVEAYQRDDGPTNSKRGGGPKPITISINREVA